jgi:hypothetical protein
MGSFADALKTFEIKANGAADAVVHGAVVEVGERVISRTPIDTGRAKSNWNYGLQTPDIHTTQATGTRTLNGIEDLPAKAGGFVHYVTNSLAYINALEDGHSKQAPQGMVKLTALEWDQIVSSQALKVAK